MSEVEQLLNQVEKDLEVERVLLSKIAESIQRVGDDKFPHLPLASLYKRPPIPPNYF